MSLSVPSSSKVREVFYCNGDDPPLAATVLLDLTLDRSAQEARISTDSENPCFPSVHVVLDRQAQVMPAINELIQVMQHLARSRTKLVGSKFYYVAAGNVVEVGGRLHMDENSRERFRLEQLPPWRCSSWHVFVAVSGPLKARVVQWRIFQAVRELYTEGLPQTARELVAEWNKLTGG